MANIRDVARRAHVSTATVSRVINESGFVAEELKARVRQAMADLNYSPNNLARSFRQNRSFMIALMISDISNPFFTSLVRGVEDVVKEGGLNLLLCNTDENPAKERSYVEVLIGNRINGVIMAPTGSARESVEAFRQHGIPVVFIDRQLAGVEADAVLLDNVSGAYEATVHLLRLGHRRIGIITGLEGVSTSEEREEGYRRALADFGIAPDERLIVRGNSRIEGGIRQTRALLALPPDVRPTALFASNNLLTIGAMRALREAGVKVPQEMAVVGFDEFESTSIIDPPLTVVAQPTYEIGMRAAKRLFAHLSQGTREEKPTVLRLKPQLIVRESCGAHLAGLAGTGQEAACRNGFGRGRTMP